MVTFALKHYFCELEDEPSPLVDSYKQSEILHSNPIAKLNYTLVDHSNDAPLVSSHCTLVNSSFIDHFIQLTNHNLWTLYFDTSRNIQGVYVGSLLVDPHGI